ncbi:MAG: sulfotransferase [Streptosporangiales bacterium]|nr:sulfotransferase [Streptosporangiales bacterium]
MGWRRRLNKTLGRTVGLEVRRVREAAPATAAKPAKPAKPAEPKPERARPVAPTAPKAPRRPVDPEIDRLLTTPVFILGSVRSGSTLLRVLLGSHSQLHAPHELHVRRLKVQFATKLSQRAMAELELDETELEHMLWDRVLHRELVKSGKRFIVEKTPSNAFVWRRLAECWPDAKFVFLLRHPVSVARSWHESNPEKRNLQEATADALKYMKAVQNARQGLSGLTVRYEDLTADPEGETKRICEFLGIDWEPEMLNYGERTEGGFQKGLGDWKDKIRSGKVQPGRDLPAADEVPDELRELCVAWGYLEEPART